MLGAACPNKFCDEPVIVSVSPQRCLKCDHEITTEFLDRYNEIVTFTKLKLEEMKHMAYLDVLQLCLKEQYGVLHPLNIWHLKTLDAAFESAINMSKWSDALEYGLKILDGYKKYNGPQHPLLGINLMKIGKIQLYLEMPKEALKYLQEAAKIIRITHGERHCLYKEQLMPLLNEALTVNGHQDGF